MLDKKDMIEVGQNIFMIAKPVVYKSADSRILLVYKKGEIPCLEDLVLTPTVLLEHTDNSISELEQELGTELLAGLTWQITPIGGKDRGYYDSKERRAKVFLNTYKEELAESELARYSRFVLQESDARKLYNLFVKKRFSGRLGHLEKMRYTRLKRAGKKEWQSDTTESFFNLMRAVIRHETVHYIYSRWMGDEVCRIIKDEEITSDVFKNKFNHRILDEGLACFVESDYDPYLSMGHGGTFSTIYRATVERADIMQKGTYSEFEGDTPWEYSYCAGEHFASTLFRAFGREALFEIYSSGSVDEIVKAHREACRKLTLEHKLNVVPVL